MIIDFHTHCFPDKIAEKAVEQLRLRSGILNPAHHGSVSQLLECQRRAGVDYSVVLNIATNPKQQHNVNEFAISQLSVDGLIPFGSVHPDSEDALDELDRLKRAGIKGIKLHPDYQEFYADDDRMLPIYEKIGKLGLITVFHCGIDFGYPSPIHCTAQRLARILPSFGGAPVVAAHLGGVCDSDNVLKYLAGKDIYLDTAYSVGALCPKTAKEVADAHGADKILFATDSPWNDPIFGIEFIKCIGLNEADEKAVLGGNAARLLKIKE